jgi:uncharacterized membrane protein (DUF4010 family)
MLLAAIHPPTLQALMWPLIFGGVSIAVYGLALTLNSLKKNGVETNKFTETFSVKTALQLTALIALVLLASAALKTWFGQAGLLAASGLAGLVDVHAPTISIASLAAAGKLSAQSAVVPVLVAYSLNAASKMVAAGISGGKKFAAWVVPSLILQVAATWAGWWLF